MRFTTFDVVTKKNKGSERRLEKLMVGWLGSLLSAIRNGRGSAPHPPNCRTRRG
jgi:hypothetical protein